MTADKFGHVCYALRVRRALFLVLTGALAGAAGCDYWPHDTRGTTDEILSTGVLHAGFAHNPPWAFSDNGRPRGVEVDLVEGLAESLGVRLHWTQMSEVEFAHALAEGQIQLAIGGLHTDVPIKAGELRLTRSYVRYNGLDYAFAVPRGESRWLVIVEEYLHGKGETVLRSIASLERQVVPQ